MKINIKKEKHGYYFQKIHNMIKNKPGKIKKINYWINNKNNTHHIYIFGDNRKIRINISFGNKFIIPDDSVLSNTCNWSMTMPVEYDACYFIHQVIFSANGIKPANAIKMLIGISPKTERDRQITFRKNVKKLIFSLSDEIENGSLTYDTAAIHFSASTGLHIEKSKRFFRRFQTYA